MQASWRSANLTSSESVRQLLTSQYVQALNVSLADLRISPGSLTETPLPGLGTWAPARSWQPARLCRSPGHRLPAQARVSAACQPHRSSAAGEKFAASGAPLTFLIPTNRFDLALPAPERQASVRAATQGAKGAEAGHDSPNTCQRRTVFLPQVAKAARELRVSVRFLHAGPRSVLLRPEHAAPKPPRRIMGGFQPKLGSLYQSRTVHMHLYDRHETGHGNAR